MTTNINPVAYLQGDIIRLVCGTLFTATAFSQGLFNELPTEDWASFVFENYEVVVTGEFPEIPEDVASDITRKGIAEVDISFEVSALHKGYLPNNVVKVRLAADMLLYPGEHISRYSKRFETRLEYAAMLESLNQRINSLRNDVRSGLVSIEDLQTQEAVLVAQRQQLASTIVSIPSRTISTLHVESFYDLGGAIKPNESYLLGLSRSRDDPDVLILQEIPAIRNIFWGRMRAGIEATLESGVGR